MLLHVVIGKENVNFWFERSKHLYHWILLHKNDKDAKKITVFIAFGFMQEKSRNFHVLKLFLQKKLFREIHLT